MTLSGQQINQGGASVRASAHLAGVAKMASCFRQVLPAAMLDHSGGNFQIEYTGDPAVVQLAPAFVVFDSRNLASYCRRFKAFAALLDRQGWGIVDRLEFGACDQYQRFSSHFSPLHLSTYQLAESALSPTPALYFSFSQFAPFGSSC